MGNSDLHRPLRCYQLLGRGGAESHGPVNVFVVSDGHWTDVTSLMASVQSHSEWTRVFTLGVGLAQQKCCLHVIQVVKIIVSFVVVLFYHTH